MMEIIVSYHCGITRTHFIISIDRSDPPSRIVGMIIWQIHSSEICHRIVYAPSIEVGIIVYSIGNSNRIKRRESRCGGKLELEGKQLIYRCRESGSQFGEESFPRRFASIDNR